MKNSAAVKKCGGERALKTYINNYFHSTFEEFKQIQKGACPLIKKRRLAAEKIGLQNLSPVSLDLPKKTHIYPNAFEGYDVREFLDSVMHIASKEKEEVLLSLVDAENLGGVNDKHGLPAGDLYLLACICIMHQVFGMHFENVSILRRTSGDEFWVICSVRKNTEHPLENLTKSLNSEMRALESAVGFEVLQNPKRPSDKGIGLHIASISSMNPEVQKHSSTIHRWGNMIDFCDRRYKSA